MVSTHRLVSLVVLSGLIAEMVGTPLPRRVPGIFNRCAPKPEYCCDSKKFNEPFSMLTKSLISKINVWKSKNKNTCRTMCVLRIKKIGRQPPSYNKVDRRLNKYAAKFKAIQQKLSDASGLKSEVGNLWKTIEKRRNESYVCQRVLNRSFKTISIGLNWNPKGSSQVLNRNLKSSTQGLNRTKSLFYQFEESNTGCCNDDGGKAKEWSYLKIADHFLIDFARKFGEIPAADNI